MTEIAATSGRQARCVPASAQEYAPVLMAAGLPDDLVTHLLDMFGRVLDGRNAHLSDGVQRAIGRPPPDFAGFAKSAAASGTWAAGD